jgi:hypothetical protein
MNGDISTLSFWLYSIPRYPPLWGRMWTIHSSSGNRTWRTGKFSMIITPVCLRPLMTSAGHGSMYEQLRMPCHRQHVVLQLPHRSSVLVQGWTPIRLQNVQSGWKIVLSWKKPWTLEELYDLDKIRKSKNHESRSSKTWSYAIVPTCKITLVSFWII